jgi:rhomboid protease GluP
LEGEQSLKSFRFQPIVSTTLVVINVFVYVLCHFTGERLYDMGRLDAFAVLINKEYGRILWSIFLHSGVPHLFNNMLILFFLGSMIEKEVGHIKYALFYFLSGIGGNLLSLYVKVVSGDLAASLGASGAIFGLDGVLLAMVLFSDKKMENVTPARVVLMIVYSLYSGFTGQNIDNAAHVGGLLTGFLAAGMMCLVQRRKQRKMTDGGYRE